MEIHNNYLLGAALFGYNRFGRCAIGGIVISSEYSQERRVTCAAFYPSSFFAWLSYSLQSSAFGGEDSG